jgi:Na+/H+ antiporter NhaD/arsenite permease-like protein
MIIPIIILLVVFILIAIRQIGNVKLQIWQIMLFGALAVLFTAQISLEKAVKAINIDVMLFLFGMFVVGQALDESGYLSHLSYKLFKKAKSLDGVILFILFGFGTASAFLMNDTLAIIGTPVMLLLAKRYGINSKVLLLTLAFAVTIGSAMSPIGNPQNLLIAVNGGIANPFVTFFKFLFIPTMINLLCAYLLLKLFFRKHFHHFQNNSVDHYQESVEDRKLAILAKISLILIIILVLAKVIVVFLEIKVDFKLTYIALISAFPILMLSPKRYSIMKKIDWHTLIFFAAMFVLMESVWDSGFFQFAINEMHLNINSVTTILIISVLLSQLISNVPLVALCLPMLIHAGGSTKEMMALAAGSTIAGNFSILGAASNVIIIQNAEKSDETLTFLEFARVGVPLTIVNTMVFWLFLAKM